MRKILILFYELMVMFANWDMFTIATVVLKILMYLQRMQKNLANGAIL